MTGGQAAVYALAALVLWLTARVLRGGWRLPAGQVTPNITPSSAIVGTLAIAAAMYFFGPVVGLLLILSIVVHEFGHVAAFRVAGHTDARLRLIPMLGGVAISDRLPSSQAKDAYISLMGPGICLALVALCLAAEQVLDTAWPQMAHYVYLFGMLTAALNAFNLLPIWPLDGGHVLRRVLYTLSPKLAHNATLALSGVAALLLALSGHIFLIFFLIIGLQSAMQMPKVEALQRPMTGREAAFAAGAWIAMLASFGLAGSPILLYYLAA
ncbi:metalloprotease [Oceanicella sp. SM1341]|uniref:metalloprotease n=1 Tax=Oceanicella sp. SM1341 TaxID=1548889 RepID=UPI000E488E72|nr:site-2 protease family protein [Oceanicella sp. SM1341]